MQYLKSQAIVMMSNVSMVLVEQSIEMALLNSINYNYKASEGQNLILIPFLNLSRAIDTTYVVCFVVCLNTSVWSNTFFRNKKQLVSLRYVKPTVTWLVFEV